ncbi:uncharacterized protein RJT21DRAFT_16030 [Scheffersomyces amazonensis]|uniref:uncharacterized protein n=1 Tax=Scheffersomyces amazonensis TaxID=1078765 RepID=UPI00315D8F80
MTVEGLYTFQFQRTNRPRVIETVRDIMDQESFPLYETSGFNEGIPEVYEFSEVDESSNDESDIYRTRNPFLILRSIVSGFLSLSSGDYKFISKVSSIMWQDGNTLYKDYYEYISTIDSFCFSQKFRAVLQEAPVKTLSIKTAYPGLCSYNYLKDPELEPETSPSKKFRVKYKSLQQSRTKLRNLRRLLRLRQYPLNRRPGTLTEDVFISQCM